MITLKMTKEEAEHLLQLVEKAEAHGVDFGGFHFAHDITGEYYSKDFLYQIRDNGGIILQKESPVKKHIVIVADRLNASRNQIR